MIKQPRLVNLKGLTPRRIDARPTVTLADLCQGPTRAPSYTSVPVHWGPEPAPTTAMVHGTRGVKTVSGILIINNVGYMETHKSNYISGTDHPHKLISGIGGGLPRGIKSWYRKVKALLGVKPWYRKLRNKGPGI